MRRRGGQSRCGAAHQGHALQYPHPLIRLHLQVKHAPSLERIPLDPDQRITDVVLRERSRLLNFIRRRVPDARDAEDILQDVFSELVEANRLLMPIEHVTGWLFRVARNRITDLFRGSARELFSEADDAADDDGRCGWRICCRHRMPARTRSTRARCSSRRWSRRSPDCRRNNAMSSSRTRSKDAASRRWPRTRESA